MKILQDLFLSELADIYDAEHRLTKALPKMAKAATCTHLQGAITAHLAETEGHVTKLEQVFECFDRQPKRVKCEATVGLIAEGEEIATEFKGSPAINAAIIAASQKVEHYEIASYGCLHEWAGLLGNDKAAEILGEILDEEKAANESLTEIARTRSNDEASGESKESSDDAPAKSASSKKKARSLVTA